MNFQDLLTKMANIESGKSLEECGGMMPAPMQQDNVNMNVSMTGSGKGGIRELISVLRDLEDGTDDDAPEIVIGKTGELDAEEPVFGEVGEEFANQPDDAVAPVDAVIPTGDDMHSKGGEARKVNGGGNPLVRRLHEMYNEIKNG